MLRTYGASSDSHEQWSTTCGTTFDCAPSARVAFKMQGVLFDVFLFGPRCPSGLAQQIIHVHTNGHPLQPHGRIRCYFVGTLPRFGSAMYTSWPKPLLGFEIELGGCSLLQVRGALGKAHRLPLRSNLFTPGHSGSGKHLAKHRSNGTTEQNQQSEPPLVLHPARKRPSNCCAMQSAGRYRNPSIIRKNIIQYCESRRNPLVTEMQ